MKYILYLTLFGSFAINLNAQNSTEAVKTIKIRKNKTAPFTQALSLPKTAPSCECPTSPAQNTLTKLGCQHPDTASVCKVVITEFDIAIIPERGEAIVLKETEGSFLSEQALKYIQNNSSDGEVFISYSNIRGMTAEGKEVVLPSFATKTAEKRANRDYATISDYINIPEDCNILSFQLHAYDNNNQMVFRHEYKTETFDRNAIRTDAVKFVFEEIIAVHKSGFGVEIRDFEISDINKTSEQLLSSNH
jgi:hypothetical protein